MSYRLHTISIFVVGLLASFTPFAGAQDGKSVVAVLDVAQVFKEHPEFKAEQKKLRDEVRSLKDAATEGETPELTKKFAATRHRLLKRESELYLETYKEILKIVKETAETYDISLVIRAAAPLEPEVSAENRMDVIKRINSNVVFQKQLDLTQIVIRKLKKNRKQVGSATHNHAHCEKCGQALPALSD